MNGCEIVLKLRVDQIIDVLKRQLKLNKKDTDQIIREYKKMNRQNHLDWDNVIRIEEVKGHGNSKQE